MVLKHQGTVQGVILDVDCPHLYKKTATEPELTVQFTGASLTAGVDLSMKYYLNIPDDIAEGKTVSMRFTMNGKTTVVTDYVKNGDTYVFSFDKIAPQCMNDSIRAEVLIGDTVVEEHDGYSVRKYAEGVMGYYSADEELMRLVVDLLNYGAASQLYVGYNTDDLANAGITAAGSDDLPAASDVVTVLKTESGVSGNVRILGATVRFDYINKIGIKLSSTENARLLLNGRELVPVDGICYTDGIHATDFDKVFVFELYEGDTLVQTLTYSVTSYVYSQMNKTEDGELTAMAELARALYRYGKSAEAYVDAMGDAA